MHSDCMQHPDTWSIRSTDLGEALHEEAFRLFAALDVQRLYGHFGGIV
jgi:hypothetical protein